MLNASARVYIASADALRLEAILGRETLFSVVGGSGGGELAEREIFFLQPDFLALDCALPGLDGPALLERLGREMPAPPRVLCLCPSQAWAEMALQKGADQAIVFPCDDESFLRCAAETALLPVPSLAAPWAPVRMEIARELLERLGVSSAYKGKQYMQTAGAVLACAPQLAFSYTGRLYPYIGKRFGCTPQAVERAIRTAIEDTWLHGNLENIGQLFGFSVDADRGKPTNAEFLSMLAEHIRRETARRMQNNGKNGQNREKGL